MKILNLVITSFNKPYYQYLFNAYKLYANVNDHVRTFFVMYDVDVFQQPKYKDMDYIYDDTEHIIIFKGEENGCPSIYDKTCLAMKICQDVAKTDNKDAYDYVVRSNLSSIFIWDRLIEFLKDKPRTKYVGAPICPVNGEDVLFPVYPSGCGMVMSADVAELLSHSFYHPMKDSYADDCVIGHILHLHDISIEQREAYHFDGTLHMDKIRNFRKQVADKIPVDVYHIRCRMGDDFYRLSTEKSVYTLLLNHFYSNRYSYHIQS